MNLTEKVLRNLNQDLKKVYMHPAIYISQDQSSLTAFSVQTHSVFKDVNYNSALRIKFTGRAMQMKPSYLPWVCIGVYFVISRAFLHWAMPLLISGSYHEYPNTKTCAYGIQWSIHTETKYNLLLETKILHYKSYPFLTPIETQKGKRKFLCTKLYACSHD